MCHISSYCGVWWTVQPLRPMLVNYFHSTFSVLHRLYCTCTVYSERLVPTEHPSLDSIIYSFSELILNCSLIDQFMKNLNSYCDKFPLQASVSLDKAILNEVWGRRNHRNYSIMFRNVIAAFVFMSKLMHHQPKHCCRTNPHSKVPASRKTRLATWQDLLRKDPRNMT